MQLGRARRHGRAWGAGCAAVLALATAATTAARGAEPAVEGFRVGYVSGAGGNVFKIGAWSPVWVQIKGGTERFAGVMEVEVPDDDGTPTAFRQVVEVGPGQTARFVTYARPGTRDPEFRIRLFDQRGRRRGPAVEGANLAQLTPVAPDEQMILTLGKPQGVDQLPTLPGFASEHSPSGHEVAVARVDPGGLDGGSLPGRWYGYDAAAAVAVDTNDKDLMEALAVRGQALADWVARGGHLVVAVGGNWQSARDSVLGPLLPAVPAGQERLTALDLKTLDTFAGASKSIASADDKRDVLVTKLEQVESRGGKVLSAASDVPLVVRGAYGFGRVTLLAFDVDVKPFASWPDRALFWVKALDIRRQPRGPANAAVIGGGGRRLYQTGVSDLVTQLRQALEQFPGVRLIPFGWVAFFIFLYILLIGPGDYFFLKKVVKRMELTWVTFPLIVVTVSLVAYFAAYLVKGRELRVNKVDVVDVDQAAGLTRGSSFINLFSPQNRDYDVSVLPQPLDRPSASPPAKLVSGTEAERPAAGTEVLVSWLGVPEPGFGGMGGGGRIGFAGGGYASAPVGASESLRGVRIPIWSTKLLAARWFGPTGPVAESDLQPVGTDRLSGTVTNRLGAPLNDAILAFGKHVYQLGTLSPGQTVRVELSQDRQLSGLLSSQSVNAPAGSDPNGVGAINRANLALSLMFHDSQSAASADQPVANNPLHYLDLTGQLALDRPMLVGRLDRPAATLALGNASTPPQVAQTTMVRVILPLASPRAAPASKPEKP